MAHEIPDRPLPDLKSWRRQTRETLLARRAGAGPGDRHQWTGAILHNLAGLLPEAGGRVLGFCWPFKGEPNLLPAVRRWIEDGGTAALPVVVRAGAPMAFRRWHPEARMARGVYDIPIPVDGEEVHPDILLVPLVGFDSQGFRLGYGGGYFDRTVATLAPRPLLVGVGFELSRLTTIHPQPHDQPMDIIVTEAGLQPRRPARGPSTTAA